jgi:indole-3-glycerol phosphate synthase
MTYLDKILARKRLEIAALPPFPSLSRPPSATRRRSLSAALRTKRGVIAEIKRASPSKGLLRADLDVVQTACQYAASGALAISVLTDGPGFHGSFDDLEQVRRAVDLPLLDKDFVLDERQVARAHACGADAVLLIVAALPGRALAELLACVASFSLEALVEVHDEAELARALAAGASLIGVNNRNLASFEVDLATSERLLPTIPEGIGRVAESGVGDAPAAARMFAAGADAVLVGEALVRAAEPTALLGQMNNVVDEKGVDR